MTKKEYFINIFFVFAVIFLSIFTNSRDSAAVPPFANPSPSDYSSGLTFDKAKELNKPIILYFYVDWCHYCKRFTPILDCARQDYGSKYSFVYINCDNPKNDALVERFGVRGYPTLYLVDKKRTIEVDNPYLGSYESLKPQLDKFLK